MRRLTTPLLCISGAILLSVVSAEVSFRLARVHQSDVGCECAIHGELAFDQIAVIAWTAREVQDGQPTHSMCEIDVRPSTGLEAQLSDSQEQGPLTTVLWPFTLQVMYEPVQTYSFCIARLDMSGTRLEHRNLMNSLWPLSRQVMEESVSDPAHFNFPIPHEIPFVIATAK
jgi:hypothetical protein